MVEGGDCRVEDEGHQEEEGEGGNDGKAAKEDRCVVPAQSEKTSNQINLSVLDVIKSGAFLLLLFFHVCSAVVLLQVPLQAVLLQQL